MAAAILTVAPGPSPWSALVVAQDVGSIVVVDDEGTEVTIGDVPERIISLSPANTEIVYALGAGDRLVGGSAWDQYPPQAADLPDVVTFNSGVIMEQVVDLEPDVVLAAGNFFTPPTDIVRMRELGIPVVVVYAPDVATVMADIELIGDAIGAGDVARDITAEMRSSIDAISSAAAQAEPPTVYYELDYFEGTSYAPAPDSFVADMISLAGGDAITTGNSAVFQMPIERLVEADPDVIVLGDAMFGHCPDSVAQRPGWGDLEAVDGDAVRPVDGELVTLPAPRLPQGLASLARAIAPDLELAGFVAGPDLCEAG